MGAKNSTVKDTSPSAPGGTLGQRDDGRGGTQGFVDIGARATRDATENRQQRSAAGTEHTCLAPRDYDAWPRRCGGGAAYGQRASAALKKSPTPPPPSVSQDAKANPRYNQGHHTFGSAKTTAGVSLETDPLFTATSVTPKKLPTTSPAKPFQDSMAILTSGNADCAYRNAKTTAIVSLGEEPLGAMAPAAPKHSPTRTATNVPKDSTTTLTSSQERHTVESAKMAASMALSQAPLIAATSVGEQPSQAGHISVFWDIENCAVPANVSAYDVVKQVRDWFYDGHREVEFTVACDASAIKASLLDELNDAHVNVVHVSHNQKNAADDKLRIKLRQFADMYKLSGSKVVLISGDVDFAPELHDMHYRQLINVVLIHNAQAKRSLIDAANKSILYSDFIANLGDKAAREQKCRNVKPDIVADCHGQAAAKNQGPGRRKLNLDAMTKQDHRISKGPTMDAALPCDTNNHHHVETTRRMSQASTPKKTISQLAAGNSQCCEMPQVQCHTIRTKDTITGHASKNSQQSEKPQEACCRTRVGLLLPPTKEDLAFWRKYLADVLSFAVFDFEPSLLQDCILSLVFPSIRTAKKACDTLYNLDSENGKVPMCLGMLVDDGDKRGNAATVEPGGREVNAAVAGHCTVMDGIKERLKQLQADKNSKAKAEASVLTRQQSLHKAQLAEFVKACSFASSSFDTNKRNLVEAARLCRASPIYSVKSKLLGGLAEHNVVALLTSPGSGKAVELALYLCEEGSRVLSIQPDDLAAQCCFWYAKSIADLSPVECWLLPSQQISETSAVVFTTAQCFFRKFLQSHETFTNFQYIVADELQESTAYQEVALALLKRHPILHSKIVMCSSHEPHIPVRGLFCLEGCDIFGCDLRFPVNVIWRRPQRNLMDECVNVALGFRYMRQQQESGGNILVLVPSLRDAFLAEALLKQRLSVTREEHVLHAVLCDGASFSVKNLPTGVWRVVFAVQCPDVVIGVLQPKCVVDCGLTETVVYYHGLLIKHLSAISKLEAERRQSFAGVSSCGTCYRLYDAASLSDALPKGAKNSRFVEDIVLRLLSYQHQIDDYFQKDVPMKMLKDVQQALQQLGALDHNGCLTELGSKLCLSDLEPRIAKLIYSSVSNIPSLDVVVLTLLVYEDLFLTHLPLNKDGSTCTLAVSNGTCMFSRVIQLYKNWRAVPKKNKGSWSVANNVNEVFMRKLHASVVGYEAALFEALNSRSMQGGPVQGLADLLEKSFPEGRLLHYEDGHRHDLLGNKIKVSPISTFGLPGRITSSVVCSLFGVPLGGSKPQLLNFSSIQARREGNGSIRTGPSICKSTPEVSEEFGPVGELIWKHQFAKQKSLASLEKTCRDASLCQGGRLIVDPLRNRIFVSGDAMFLHVAFEHLRDIVATQVTKLKNKDREVTVTPTDSPFVDHPVRAVLGMGGEVMEVLSPTVFRTMKIFDLDSPRIQRRLNELGNIVQYRIVTKDHYEEEDDISWHRSTVFNLEQYFERKGKFRLYSKSERFPMLGKCHEVTYKTATEASRAYGMLCAEYSELSIEVDRGVLDLCSKQRQRKPAFCANVSWARRICTGIGFAKLSNPADIESLSLPICLTIDGEKVECVRNRKHEGQLYISGLPPTIAEELLEKCLSSALPVALAWVRVIRDPPFNTTSKDKHEMREMLKEVFEQHAAKDGFFAICDHADNKDCWFTGAVFFSDATEGQSACVVLDGQSSFSKQGHEVRLEAKASVVESFVFPTAFFKMVRKHFRAAVKEHRRGLHGVDKLSVCEREIDSLRIMVEMKASSLSSLEKVVATFNELLENSGVAIKCTVRCKDVAEVVNESHSTSLYVHCRPDGSIRLLGSTENAKEVCKKLEHHTTLLATSSRKVLPLIGEDFSLLKPFLAAHGFVLRTFAQSCGLLDASFEPSLAALLVIGPSTAIDKAEEALKKLEKKPVISIHSAVEACPVCREEVGHGGKERHLELCGHAHCTLCLQLVLHCGSFPLRCLHKGCGSPWAIQDVTQLTGNKPEGLSELARRWLEQAVAKGSRWQRCPTPECPFVWNNELTAKAQGVKQMGRVTVCPSCTNAVCFSCCSLYHYGMSCETYQDRAAPREVSDQAWLSKDPRCRALCARCEARLQRGGGPCRVSACWRCYQIFCWRCRETFRHPVRARMHLKKLCKAQYDRSPDAVTH